MNGESLAFRLPRARRIRARRDFTALQSSASRAEVVRVHAPHFLFVLGKTPASLTCAGCRIGLTVTRKIGNAVRRNRIKRLLREAFRLDPAFLPRGVDLVVIAKDGAHALCLAEVQQEFGRVAAQLRRRAAEILARSSLET